MKRGEVKSLALLMAVNCVRNTVIENYHSEGKLTQDEMKHFNKEVSDKLYTFLEYMINKPLVDWEALQTAMQWMYPTNWDEPKLDQDLVKAASFVKKKGNPFRSSGDSIRKVRPRDRIES